MLQLLLNRTLLQLVVSASQVVMLALFVVIWPRQADVPRSWAADYFTSIAIMTPVFMLFSFELRKITSGSAGDSDILQFHRQRITGVILSIVLCVVALPILIVFDMQQSTTIYLAVLTFKISQTLGDQISAHYEWHDNFKESARTSALKAVSFVIVGTATGFYIGPTIAIFAASTSTILVAWAYDRPRGAFNTAWKPVSLSGLSSDTWAAGLGSFLISTTLYGPRLIAAALLGEGAILAMGVGQTINRFGQILSNSLSQTLIVLQKRVSFPTVSATAVLFGIQLFVLMVMIIALPLWNRIFGYAAVEDNFGILIVLLLIFGLASQFNYLIQSLNLVQRGAKGFVLGPLVFIAVFATLMASLWGIQGIDVLELIICMLIARSTQIIYNLKEMRIGGRAL
jgi:hypothetical protein